MSEEEGEESYEGAQREGEGEERDQQTQETFRQGYGSGRRRAAGGYGTRERRYGGRRGGEYGGEQRGFGRNRDRERDHGPVPVEEGQELTLTIDALGRHGDGIARLNNFVIFVPGGKAGEQVKIRITTVRGSFATGEIVS